MKKLMMTLIAAVLMSSAAFAQDEKKECKCPEKKPDKTEMVKHRTDGMVKKFGLDENQAAQLLELNTKYADKMKPRGHHKHRPGAGRPPKDDKKIDKKTDANTGATAQQEADRKQHDADRKQHEADRKAYEEELQKIMTADQYAAYQADMKKNGDRGPRGPRGPRPEKKDKE